jgi:hypothetical protein
MSVQQQTALSDYQCQQSIPELPNRYKVSCRIGTKSDQPVPIAEVQDSSFTVPDDAFDFWKQR